MTRKGKRRRKYENSNQEIKKTCKPHDSTTNMDMEQLKKNLGFVPSNLYWVKKRSKKDVETNEITPQACVMYPLSTTALNGKLEPFPTICWLTSTKLKTRVSALEKSAWIKDFHYMLKTNVNTYGKRMRNAHEMYAKTRTNLLTEEDRDLVIKNGWTQALSENRGVAGILKTSVDMNNNNNNSTTITTWDISVKCLHAHLAHYLCFPEHDNIIGIWTWNALNKNYDSNRICTTLPLLNSIYQLWNDNNSNDEIVKMQAQMLKKCLNTMYIEEDNNNNNNNKIYKKWDDIHQVKTVPPENVSQMLSKNNNKHEKILKPIKILLEKAWDVLPWKLPKTLSNDYSNNMGEVLQHFKSVMIVGNPEYGAMIESNELYVGLFYLKENMHYPTHAHEAFETYTFISGNGDEVLHQRDQKDDDNNNENTAMTIATPTPYIHNHGHQPHAIKTSNKPLVCLYAWTRGINVDGVNNNSNSFELPGKYWFCS